MIPTFILKKVIEVALDRVAQSPNTNMTQRDVPAARDSVLHEVEHEVESIIRNQTNNEPWYKSRVLLGSFFTLLAASASIGNMYFDGVPNSFDDYWLQLSVIGGSAMAIYGRTVARKPIGE